MNLKQASVNILNQLKDVFDRLSDAEFTSPVELLSGSSVGQHFRHIVEFYHCLTKGNPVGIVNYDKRDHDKTIERDRVIALAFLGNIIERIEDADDEKRLILHISYDTNSDTSIEIGTNFNRELAYNIEHAVHHMAIIKIGIQAINKNFEFPENFGVAVSTVKYKRKEPAQ